MKCRIETVPDYRIAYLRRVGPYGPANLEVMEKLKRWAEANRLLDSAVLFAVAQDNPDTTPPEKCRYDACLVIPDDYPPDDSVCEGKLPGGKYLMFEVLHTPDAIQSAYREMFQVLHSKGYAMDHRPIVERYTCDLLARSLCEIGLPVK